MPIEQFSRWKPFSRHRRRFSIGHGFGGDRVPLKARSGGRKVVICCSDIHNSRRVKYTSGGVSLVQERPQANG